MVHEVSKVIGILEQNQIRKQIAPSTRRRSRWSNRRMRSCCRKPVEVGDGESFICAQRLTESYFISAASWKVTRFKVAFDELTRIYHAENAISLARPPQNPLFRGVKRSEVFTRGERMRSALQSSPIIVTPPND